MAALESVYERAEKAGHVLSVHAVGDIEKYMNFVAIYLEFAEELIEEALKERGSDVVAINVAVDGEKVVSRSYRDAA